MLQMYMESAAGVTVAQNEAIVFTNKVVQTGCTAVANTPTNTVTLNRPGFYIIQFNASVSNDAAASELINVIMENNGVEVESAQSSATSDSATDIENLSFSAIVQVRPNCPAINNTANLTFVLTNATTLVYYANVVVTKIA